MFLCIEALNLVLNNVQLQIQALTAVSEYRPSPEEAPLIDWVFSTGDPERTGKINPQTATRIFSASNLPPDALARIWEIASVDSKDGLLDRQGVGVALRLIGHAQSGAEVSEGLVKRGEQRTFGAVTPVLMARSGDTCNIGKHFSQHV